MSSFSQSQWADSAFAREYRENSDHYIPDRQYLFHVLRSFFQRFVVRSDRPARVCDLGCGDGVLTGQLVATGAPMSVTLVDGSAEMLDAARRRLADWPGRADYVQRGFDELIGDSATLGELDFVVSGFAIHHLLRPERKALFRVIERHLKSGASFMNIETALAPVESLDEWYYELWREWIAAHAECAGLDDRYRSIPDQARANPDNHYSPLDDQLADLREAGFVDVACHYRNGIFAIYTGRKPGAGLA